MSDLDKFIEAKGAKYYYDMAQQHLKARNHHTAEIEKRDRAIEVLMDRMKKFEAIGFKNASRAVKEAQAILKEKETKACKE